MNNSEETTEIDGKAILEAIMALSNKIDDIDKKVDDIDKKVVAHDAQFEAIRQGLVLNSAAFDRLESVVYTIRSDVSGLKADMKELTESVYQINKTKGTLELKS